MLGSSTSSSSSSSSVLHAAKHGLVRLDAEFMHPPNLTVQQLFHEHATTTLGRRDFTPQLNILASHLVESVNDLRLLIQENQLRDLGLPIRLCVWIEEEVAKLAAPANGVQVSQQIAQQLLPPIPLSAPVTKPLPHTTSTADGPTSTSSPSPTPILSSSATTHPPSASSSSPEKVALFHYHFDFDTFGLLYYLGSEGRTASYLNPGERGMVQVSSSALTKDSAPANAIVGRELVRCITTSINALDQSNYFQVELKDFTLRPTHYSLKHFVSSDAHALRNWNLQGSIDGKDWQVLKEHKNDTNLNGRGSTCTWIIDPEQPSSSSSDQTPARPNQHAHVITPSIALASPKYWYRFFRIILTGPNSCSQYALACSGMELYGYVMSVKQMDAWVSAGNVSAIPPFTAANYPPWPLPKDGVLNIQQSLQLQADHRAAQAALDAALVASASQDDLNSTLNGVEADGEADGDGEDRHGEDDFKESPSLATLAAQLASISLLDGVGASSAAAVAIAAPSSASSASSASAAASASAPLFTYSSDFDTNGIIYALATNNRTSPWVNPMDAGLLTVTASSVMDDSTSLAAVVGRDTVRCVTKPLPNSWMMIDFHADKRVLPTHYSMRHYSSWGVEALRTWKLEGSTNGEEWTLLRDHINDEHLDGKGSTHTWTIHGGDIQTVARQCQPMRYLRITQTGENSNRHHYLALSGFELYGRLLNGDGVTPYTFSKSVASIPPSSSSSSASAAASSQLLTFPYTGHDCRDGIIWWLATSGGSRPWTNPAEAGLVRVSASTLNEDSEPVSAVVGTAVVRCVTKPIPDQWFAIDFGPHALIQPTSYSLRHYSSYASEALRYWRFQGTTDGDPQTAHWVTISEHENDASLEGKGATHTWKVQTSRFFRCFRIFQFDKNSNRHYYLALSGFEIYGNYRRITPAGLEPSSALSQPLSATPSSAAASAAAAALPVPAAAANPFVPSDPALVAPLASAAPTPAPAPSLPSIPAPLSAAAASPSCFPPLPPSSHASIPLDEWDPDAKGNFLLAQGQVLRNTGSNDKWQLCRGKRAYASGLHKASVKITHDQTTTNTWRMIIGAVPVTLDCKGAKQWVGTGGSWGYIGGTGGKCHTTAVTVPYGSKYGSGDIITVVFNCDRKYIAFFRNEEFQGLAFNDLNPPVHLAASLTATGGVLEIVPTPNTVIAYIEHMERQYAGQSSSSSLSQQASIPIPIPIVPVSSLQHGWDPVHKSQFMSIDPLTGYARNLGSNDKWQSVRALQAFNASMGLSRHRFAIELIDMPKTNNSWQVIVGVVPTTFTCNGAKQWVGAGESWGYIGGTGGKCFNVPKSTDYGQKFGRSGDVIMVQLDFDKHTIEFFINGVYMGVAFNNLQGTVYPAVSITATGATVRLRIQA